jgi:hypothetical protein
MYESDVLRYTPEIPLQSAKFFSQSQSQMRDDASCSVTIVGVVCEFRRLLRGRDGGCCEGYVGDREEGVWVIGHSYACYTSL